MAWARRSNLQSCGRMSIREYPASAPAARRLTASFGAAEETVASRKHRNRVDRVESRDDLLTRGSSRDPNGNPHLLDGDDPTLPHAVGPIRLVNEDTLADLVGMAL